ncbi:MAG: hypothetical protein LBF22_03690 [Deltaproteobacteria bacterium]|jgi:chemotaxis methyl-accepting protein methylase|nr:hypothetical protein [Deltaproteobacteria bacterium]
MTNSDYFDEHKLSLIFQEFGKGGTKGTFNEIKKAFLKRAEILNLPAQTLLQKIFINPLEALKIWDIVALRREDSFFNYPETFEVAGELMREWATLSPTRSLKALILGAGRGFEAASLSMEMSTQGLLIKGFDVEINSLDLSKACVDRAKSGVFTEQEVYALGSHLLRKHLTFKRGEYYLKDTIKKLTRCYFGDPFFPSDHKILESKALEAYEGEVDILFARSFWRDLPDDKIEAFVDSLEPLLKDGALAFLAPGEIFVPKGKLSLEERRGVFYFRKGEAKRHKNSFFAPKRRETKLSVESSHKPSPRLDQIRKSAIMALPTEPSLAKEYALEAIISAANESGTYHPQDYKTLSQAEEALCRPKMAKLIMEAYLLLTGEA